MLDFNRMRDTSRDAERRYFELLGAQTPLQRLATAARLSKAIRELVTTAIVTDKPHASASEVNSCLAERLYGAQTAQRLYPSVKPNGR